MGRKLPLLFAGLCVPVKTTRHLTITQLSRDRHLKATCNHSIVNLCKFRYKENRRNDDDDDKNRIRPIIGSSLRFNCVRDRVMAVLILAAAYRDRSHTWLSTAQRCSIAIMYLSCTLGHTMGSIFLLFKQRKNV